MMGAIHRPQRCTRTAWVTTPASPSRVNRWRSGSRLRLKIAVSTIRLMLNSGAAIDQLMTPARESQ